LSFSQWKTVTAMMSADGATPRVRPSSPAAIPATWVPWAQAGLAQGAALPDPESLSAPFGQ